MDSKETAEHIDNLFKELLGVLLTEKYRDDNNSFARDIAVTITEVQKAYAWYKVYVHSNLEESK